MTGKRSEWQTKELANAFLNGVRGAIPGAELQLAVLRKIALLWVPSASVVLDMGCGDGILGRLLLDTFPSANAVFADFSDPMLDAARSKLSGNLRATVVKVDFSSPEWLNAVKSHTPFDIVVSGFAIHHLPDKRKRRLYAEIYDVLSPDGVFLNLEHVASLSSAGEKLFDEFFVDHLHEFHRISDPKKTRGEIEGIYYNRADKKENILAPVDVQCQWLREIGFQDVDCYFKVFELALFGGRKTANRQDACNGK
jgi:tRNA (cmo5U34)-methyltransferase